MKGYREKITTGMRALFVLMVLGVILFWIFGEMKLPSEGVREQGRCQTLSGDWARILPDGGRILVKVPGICQADRLESVSVETTLPQELEEDTWLCVRSSWQDLELLVDQVVRRRYTAEGCRPFGKNSPGAYVFLKLSKEDAGKVFRITSISDSSYSGTLNEVYMGDRIGILTYLMQEHGGGLLLSMFLLVLSGLSILVSMALRRFYQKEIILEYLAWGTFLTSLWLVAGSKMRQFIFPNISVAAGLSFLAAMLALFPFLIYMDGVQRQRYQKGYVCLELLVIVNFVMCTVLQMTNQKEFMETMIFMCALAALSFAYIVFTISRDFRKKRIWAYPLAAAGMIVLVISALGELIVAFRNYGESGGIILCLGLMCLLALAIVENVRKLFYMEREKQRAVLANESKGKFLANMSHEIRTPINTVIGMNEMILRENHDPAIQGYAENINNASKTLLSLVNDVLDFSKMESGSLEISNSSYYLSSLLNDTFHVLKARAEKKHLDVRLNVDENLPSILVGDEVRIRKVLNHLFSNSIKFTQEGGITFSAQGEWNDDGTFCLSFSVADTGIGIQKEDLARLYDSFTKLEEDKNCTIPGSGLGLNLTKRFVEEMHGDIRVQSVYGTGTLFTVRIPQEIEDPEPIGDLQKAYEREQLECAKDRTYLKAPDACVLSVDDNEMNLAVVRGLLKRTNLQLDTVTGGTECLIYTRRKKYDLIFMDHMMPEPDGISTLHLLRQETDNQNADTPVVALTANAVAGSREEYLKAGFDDYLSKPVVAEKLEQMLQKYLPKEKVFFQEETNAKEGPGWEEILKDAPQSEEPQGQETEADGGPKNIETRIKEPGGEGSGGEKMFIEKAAGMPYCGNDEEMYLEILQAYYEQGQEYLQKLPKLYENEDWVNYGIIAHAVKSTSLTIGAASVSKQAKRQELASKEGRLEELKSGWPGFIQDYESALKEAADMLGIEEDSGEAVKEPYEEGLPEGYLEECKKLLEQIQGYEMSEALEQIDRLMSVKNEKILEQVRKYVHDFDYDGAERCLQDWLTEQEAENK